MLWLNVPKTFYFIFCCKFVPKESEGSILFILLFRRVCIKKKETMLKVKVINNCRGDRESLVHWGLSILLLYFWFKLKCDSIKNLNKRIHCVFKCKFLHIATLTYSWIKQKNHEGLIQWQQSLIIYLNSNTPSGNFITFEAYKFKIVFI